MENKTYQVSSRGVKITIHVRDSGETSDDIVGDSRYIFSAELAELLAPMVLVMYNGRGEGFPDTFGALHGEAAGDEELTWESGELVLDVDGGIGALALLIDRGEDFSFTVDTLDALAFWACHDLVHAEYDTSASWADGNVDFPRVEGWAENRAHFEGARRAARAGVSLDLILSTLSRARAEYESRFPDDEFSCIDEFISDPGIEVDTGRVSRLVDALAQDALEAIASDRNLDPMETAQFATEGNPIIDDSPGLVLVALPTHAWEAWEAWGRDCSIEQHAALSLELAVQAKVLEVTNRE